MAKTRTVTYNARARAELSAANRWYDERSLTAAVEFRAALKHLLDLLLQSPALGELADDTRRVARVEGYPYLVVYRERARGIRIVRGRCPHLARTRLLGRARVSRAYKSPLGLDVSKNLSNRRFEASPAW